MADKEKEAYYKGKSDSDKHANEDNSGILKEFLSPTYKPTEKHEEAYKAGWKDGDDNRKK